MDSIENTNTVRIKKNNKEKKENEKKEKREDDTGKKEKREKKCVSLLKGFHEESENIIEVGVDEAGRGPLFGRVYSAAVILPKNGSFDLSMVKDSKKFTSKKKIEEAAEYIKEHAIGWHVSFEDEKTIDSINILQATQQSMHAAIHAVRNQYNRTMLPEKKETVDYSFLLLIDGNYFNAITLLNKNTTQIESLRHLTVERGDNTYASIAAASILAKVSRDQYIEQLCLEHPELAERYSIDKNMGYGAKVHMDGIKQYGITEWHRKSYAPCRRAINESTTMG